MDSTAAMSRLKIAFLMLVSTSSISAWQVRPRYIAIPVEDIRWLEMAPPGVQAAASNDGRPLYTIPKDHVQLTSTSEPSSWAEEENGNREFSAGHKGRNILYKSVGDNRHRGHHLSSGSEETKPDVPLAYDEDVSSPSGDISGEEATRVERQSGGHHEYVDFGAHTGHHGAFGWHADFPVRKHSR